MFAKKLSIGVVLFIGLSLLLNASLAQDATTVSFEKQIKPILENHCINCHGPEKEEGTRLDIRDDAMD